MKSLYSLILSEEVVEEIDKLALKRGVNRSRMVNDILAEYVSVITPEKQVKNMFGEIENLLADYFDGFSSSGRTAEMKRALDVKYKPKITYELQLDNIRGVKIGSLKMQWRTQHIGVINCINRFVTMWAEIENRLLPENIKKYIEYSLEEGKFTRNFAVLGDTDDVKICEGISGYVKNFDRIFSDYLKGKTVEEDIEKQYAEYILSGGYVL